MKDYGNYKRKMLMLRKARDVLYRFRVLLICLGTTAIVGASGAMAVTGKITDIEESKNFYTYGDDIALKSEAVFKDSHIEYAVENSDEWSIEAPTLVGNYKYRAASTSSFNSKINSKEQLFKIVPKEVNIQVYEYRVDYGDDFTIKPPELLYEDKLAAGKVIVSDRLSLETTAYVDVNSLKVEDNKGNDVTYCYHFNPEKKKVYFNKKQLKIKQFGSSKIYDGTALKNEEYDVTGDLLPGDRIVLPPSLDITDVGTLLNKREVKIVNKDNVDVTHFYDIVNEADELTITKRHLTISSLSDSKMYDGNPIKTEYELKGDSILDKHKLIVDFKYKDFKEVGEYINEFTYDIVDKKTNESVLNNYEVRTEQTGRLKITKRPLSIDIKDATKQYDGKELICDKYDVINPENLLSNHKVVIEGSIPTIINKGTVTNRFNFKVVDETTYEDFTKYYNISITNGSLSVTSIPLTVKVNKLCKEYDSTPLVGDSISVFGLIDGDSYELVSYGQLTTYGVKDNNVRIAVRNRDGFNVTNNYDITYEGTENALEITKRPLKVQSFNASKVFDNTDLSSYNDVQVVGDKPLVGGDYIMVTKYAKLKNVGIIDNVFEVNVKNSSGSDVSNCYNISYQTGSLEVTKAVINLYPEYSKIYDGRQIPSNFEIRTLDTLPYNCRLVTKVSCDGVDVGSHNINLDSISVYSGSEDVTSNFIINVPVMTLSINRRDICFTAESIDKIYDGTLTKASKYSISNSSLGYGDEVTYEMSGETDLPTIEPIKSRIEKLTIKNVDGKVVNSNYNITLLEGTINVRKIPISFSTPNQEHTYDKEPLIPTTNVTYDKKALLPGHHAKIEMMSGIELIDVVDTRHNSFKVTIYDENEVDVTNKYYDVTLNFGTLKISPAYLYINAVPRERIYNGKPIDVKFKNWTTITHKSRIGYTGIIYDDYRLSAMRTNHEDYIDAGYYYYDIIAKLEDNTGKIIQTSSNDIENSNYQIVINDGIQLKISPREVTITFRSAKFYLGAEFENYYTKTNGDLIAGHHFGPVTMPTFTEVGRGQINTIDSITILDDKGNDVTHNYLIRINPGIIDVLAPGEKDEEPVEPNPNPNPSPDVDEPDVAPTTPNN